VAKRTLPAAGVEAIHWSKQRGPPGPSRWAVSQQSKFAPVRMVEAAGIEPASLCPSAEASTHIVNLLGALAGVAPIDGTSRRPARLPGFAGFPACDLAAPWRVHLLLFHLTPVSRSGRRKVRPLLCGHCVCRCIFGIFGFVRGFTRPPDNLGAPLQRPGAWSKPFRPHGVTYVLYVFLRQ